MQQGGPEVVVKKLPKEETQKGEGERERERKTVKQSRRTVHSRGGRWTCSIWLSSPSGPSFSVLNERHLSVIVYPVQNQVRLFDFHVNKSTAAVRIDRQEKDKTKQNTMCRSSYFAESFVLFLVLAGKFCFSFCFSYKENCSVSSVLLSNAYKI